MPEVLGIPGGSGGGGAGPEGPPGPKGEYNHRGAWAGGTEYAKGDSVEEGGSSYASLKAANVGHKPSELGEWWGLISKKGDAGAVGEKGEKGLIGEKGEKGTTGEAGSPKTAKAPLEVVGSEIALKAGGITAEFLGPESVETAKIKDKAVTDAKLAGLTWVNVEEVNAGLEQTIPIQVAVFNGLVFIRGLGKVTVEVAAKGKLFKLPAAARPTAERHLVYNTLITASSTGNLNIKVNGEVETVPLLAVNKTPAFDLCFPL